MSEVPLQCDVLCERTTCGGDKYRGTSLIRKRYPVGPYRRPGRRVLGGS